MAESFDVILINTVENLGVYPPLSLCYLQAVLESDKCGNLVTNQEQEYLSRKDVLSGNKSDVYNLEPFLLRDIIKNIEASSELHIVSTGFKEDALKERAEKLKRIFDPLVKSV